MAMHDREVITELANLLRTSGDWILEEGVKLSLTSVSLSILNEGFRKLENYRLQQIDTSTGVAPVNLVLANKGDDDKNRIFDDLTFLYAFIPKISALKVIHGTSTIQGPICLEEFRNLQVLEVKKVPVHLLSGIEKLQLQLCTIICSRCIQAAQDLFEACGGDMCSAHMWPKLTTVSLSSNNLDTLDGSFRLLPAVKTLDLSQNMLRNTENYLENLTNLHYVNLSCNRLVHVPTFSVTAKHRLVKLILSNNNLDNIDGIQELINLVELDLSGNCLCTHDKINLLCYLHRLNVLNLRENPLAYHANHRLLTVQYLSPVAAKEIVFDGILISPAELMYVPKVPQHYRRESVQVGAFSTLTDHIRNHEPYPPLSEVIRDNVDGNSDSYLEKVARRKTKVKKKARKIAICDLESSTEYCSSSKESSRAATPVINDGEYLGTREQYETSRKQLGPRWLVAINVHKNHDPDSDSMTATNESSNTPQPIERPDDDYYMNDTMDNNLSKMTGEGKCHDMKNLQDHSNTLDPARLEWQQPENIEEDAEGETYIVTIDKDESTESQKNVFLVVGTQFLWEKDLYGQLHEKLDLRSLLSIHPYTANSNCAGFHGQTALRLTFDYCKKSRQERKYIMEDDQDCQKLLTQLQPFIAVRNMESERKDLYHCLKCQRNFPFLKKVTKLVDSKDVNRLCPHCDSSMLIELSGEEIQARAPSGDAIEQVGSLKYCKAVDSSCPLATSSTQNTPVKSRMLGMNHSKSLTESFLSFADSTTISSSYRSLTDTTSDFFTLDESKGCTSETDRLQTYGVPKNQHFYQLTYPSSGASDKSFSKAEDTFLRHEEENVKLMDNQEHLTSEESDITVLSGQDSATMVQKLTLEGVPNIDKTIHSSVNSDCNLPRVSRGGSSDDRKKVLDDCSYGMQLDSLTSGRTASDKTSPMGSLTNRTLNSMVESIYESSISRKHSSESSVFDKVIENQESDIFIVKRVKDKNIAGYTAGNKRSAWYNEDTVPLSTDHDDAYPSHKNPFSDDSETLLDTNEYSSNPFITNDKNPFVETTDDSDQTCLQKCENVCKDVTQESRMYDDNGLTIQNNPFLDEVTDETDCTSSGQLIVTNSLKSDSSVASAAFAEGENPFRSEVLVNMGDCCSIQRLTGVQVETPQNTDTNVVRYNFEDYGQVDHRIMLWLTMKVFNEENEECQALLRCGIVQYMNPDEFQGLLIVSNKKLYIVRIVGEERDNPDNWATCVENQLITEVHYVDVGYGHQSFRLEFGTEGSSYTFIIRDHGRCKKFIHGLTELVRSTTSSQKSKLEGISREYGETVDNIISQIIAPNNEETEVIDVDTGKLKILFISGHWKKANTTELWQPITLIVSHCTIYICHQNYQWPMPRLQALVHAELAKTQFEVKSKQVINEIECLEIYDICPTHVKIVFFNEDGMKDPESWDIAMETEQSRDQLIHALSKPWQDDFGVALSINQSKEIPCNVQTNFSIVAAQPFFGFGK